jgi:DNA-binding NarL/FixJ family response regulator
MIPMAPERRKTRVLIVDDHPLMREGIANALLAEADLELAGEASDGAEAIEKARALKPDVILIDLQMPRLGGLDAIPTILDEAPDARIAVLTTYGGDAYAERALRLGALGFLLKSSLHRELVDAVRAVGAGRRYVSPVVAEQILSHMNDDRLSERELDVLRLISRGEPNKGVARRLSISDQTVKVHVKSIFSKLGVCDRTHAVTVAVRRGLIDI